MKSPSNEQRALEAFHEKSFDLVLAGDSAPGRSAPPFLQRTHGTADELAAGLESIRAEIRHAAEAMRKQGVGAVIVLGLTEHLAGPSLLPSGGAVLEAVVFGGIGAVGGLAFAIRHHR